jgi:vesicle coat complex subunit
MEKTLNKQELFNAIENLYGGGSLKAKVENKINDHIKTFIEDNHDYLDQWLGDVGDMTLKQFYLILESQKGLILAHFRRSDGYLDFYEFEETLDEFKDFERSFNRTRKIVRELESLLD